MQHRVERNQHPGLEPRPYGLYTLHGTGDGNGNGDESLYIMRCTVHTAPRPGAGNRNGDHWVPYPFHHRVRSRVLYWAIGFYYTLCCYRSRSLCCVHYSPFPAPPLPVPVPGPVQCVQAIIGERRTCYRDATKPQAACCCICILCCHWSVRARLHRASASTLR